MAQHKYSIMDVEDYLTLNRNSKNIRYEYLDGEIRNKPHPRLIDATRGQT